MTKHPHDLEKTEFTDADNNAIAEAVESYWGERCPDFEESCPTCAAWKQYDKMRNLTNVSEGESK